MVNKITSLTWLWQLSRRWSQPLVGSPVIQLMAIFQVWLAFSRYSEECLMTDSWDLASQRCFIKARCQNPNRTGSAQLGTEVAGNKHFQWARLDSEVVASDTDIPYSSFRSKHLHSKTLGFVHLPPVGKEASAASRSSVNFFPSECLGLKQRRRRKQSLGRQAVLLPASHFHSSKGTGSKR